MCGIAGIFRLDGTLAEQDQLLQMAHVLKHRGPDGFGYYTQGPLGLAMTRLAIIDVSGGQQPIFNEDRTAAIVCNGEIYNYRPLRAELERKGHHFRTNSDVEVALHLYEDEGAKCFSKLNGMFAAAIADFKRGGLVLARDPFGQKPLYLWRGSKQIAFASELKALIDLPGLSRNPSFTALASFLQFRYIPAPLSIFENIEKLPPGSYLEIDQCGKYEVRRYWQISLDRDSSWNGSSTSGKDIQSHFVQAVERHLMSERPLGVFLSGGIDSAAIVACMHELGHREIHTYTVGFDSHTENEFDSARRVAERFHSSHTEVMLNSESFWQSLEEVVYAADEPLADLTTVPLYRLAESARRDVVVVLSGEGSDELLAGYGGIEDTRRMFDNLHALRPLAPVARMLLGLKWPQGFSRRLQTLSGSDADYLARNPLSMTEVFDEDCRLRFGSEGIHDQVLEPLRKYYETRQTWHGVNASLGAMIEWWLPDDLLHKADRMTMAHSIELRCPFLDREFAEYCARLPLDDKVQARRTEPTRKIALKRAFANMLPEGIAFQPKKGFTIPVYTWLTSEFASCARAEMRRESALGCSLFKREFRQALIERAMAGDKASQHQVWSLIILNKWADRWI